MPVLVIGADTVVGAPLMEHLAARDGEVRAFVTDAQVGLALKQLGVKVAIGDVSDASHISAAATGCFSVVAISEAATDSRERAFASTPEEVLSAWSEAINEAQPQRVIWIQATPTPSIEVDAPEFLVVQATDRSVAEVASEAAEAEDRAVWK
jgi:uncharacterized protein YbjT (DUF2867 family)